MLSIEFTHSSDELSEVVAHWWPDCTELARQKYLDSWAFSGPYCYRWLHLFDPIYWQMQIHLLKHTAKKSLFFRILNSCRKPQKYHIGSVRNFFTFGQSLDCIAHIITNDVHVIVGVKRKVVHLVMLLLLDCHQFCIWIELKEKLPEFLVYKIYYWYECVCIYKWFCYAYTIK